MPKDSQPINGSTQMVIANAASHASNTDKLAFCCQQLLIKSDDGVSAGNEIVLEGSDLDQRRGTKAVSAQIAAAHSAGTV